MSIRAPLRMPSRTGAKHDVTHHDSISTIATTTGRQDDSIFGGDMLGNVGVRRGTNVTRIDLPKTGARGNSHMLMMDRNSDAIAQLIQNWMVEQGLSK